MDEEMMRQAEEFIKESEDKSKWTKHPDIQRSEVTYNEESE